MLDAIWSGLKGIWDAIISVIEFVIDFVRDLVDLVVLVGESVLEIPEYLSFLPGSVITVIVAVFGIVVLYKILGREG